MCARLDTHPNRVGLHTTTVVIYQIRVHLVFAVICPCEAEDALETKARTVTNAWGVLAQRQTPPICFGRRSDTYFKLNCALSHGLLHVAPTKRSLHAGNW